MGVRTSGWLLVVVAALASTVVWVCAGSVPPPPVYFGRLVRAPLDPPIVVNGSFGEHRSGHFHAGLDLSTGGATGQPVFAPIDGWVERVRTSGSGYGRSVYLRGDDGRLLVFAHLDAFADSLDEWVARQQESSGRYEQDLWPEPKRFRFAAGSRIAWSGQSGAGGPHLHFEIRGSDIAYNPLLAGFALSDSIAPDLEYLRLEPLDDRSFVERAAAKGWPGARSGAPLTIDLDGTLDTLVVHGRVRAIVTVRDRFGSTGRNAAPWSVEAEFSGAAVECRFDRASWADEMSESDFVYREGGGRHRGIRLWAPAAFRPVVLRTAAPDREEVGVIEVRAGDPPRSLVVAARDVAGNRSQVRVMIRGPRSGEEGETSIETQAEGESRTATDRMRESETAAWPGSIEFESLAGRYLRVAMVDAAWRDAEVAELQLEGSPRAMRIGVGDAAVLDVGGPARTVRLRARGGGGKRARWSALGSPLRVSPASERASDRFGDFAWGIPTGSLFDASTFVAESLGVADATAELQPLGVGYALHPSDLPLRAPLRVSLAAPYDSLPGVGLYVDSGDGWSDMGATYARESQRFEATTRHLGRFALFRDTTAPRIRWRRPGWIGPSRGYSQWQLRALVTEQGSGLDRNASYLEVDGKRVPTEWDGEANTLRWRPLARPARGTHRYRVVATDRAGNEASREGSFVLD